MVATAATAILLTVLTMVVTIVVAVVFALATPAMAEQNSAVGNQSQTPALKPANSTVVKLSYTIVKRIPHRQSAFTQGLLWHEGELWESSGQYGQSALAVLDPDDGTVKREVKQAGNIFAEGIAVREDSLLQLSWRAETAFCYATNTMKKTGEFSYTGEGWGLSNDGEQYIMSDGSANLQFRDHNDFSLRKKLAVTLGGRPLAALNELEWIDGLIVANVWRRNDIVVIDPAKAVGPKDVQSAPVVATLDLSQLKRFEAAGANVLNGIAWQADEQLLWVTGKYWRNLYALKISPKFTEIR